MLPALRRACGLIFLPVAASLAGCAAHNSSPRSPLQHYVSQVDDLGRKVMIPSPLRRLVTIGPGATEMVCAVGGAAMLVGRDQMSVYPPQVSKVPVLGSYTGPFLEKVVAARPQLLLMQGETWSAAQANLWQSRLKVPVAVINAHSLSGTASDMAKVGKWLGHTKAATAAALRLLPHLPAGDVAKLRSRHVTAFFEVARSPQLWTAGDDTLIGDVLKQAGLVNAASAIHGYKQYSPEALLARQPQIYIVASPSDAIEPSDWLPELRKDPLLKHLKCVQQGRVIVVWADLVERSGPRLGRGIENLFWTARSWTTP